MLIDRAPRPGKYAVPKLANMAGRTAPKRNLSILVAYGVVVALDPTASHAQSISSEEVKPEIATSLKKFGIPLVVGAAALITKAGKSSVPPEDAALLGQDMTRLVDQYRTTVSDANFGGTLVKTNGDVVIVSGLALATMSGVGTIPAFAVASVAKYGNNKFAGYISKDGIGRAQGLLSSGLQTMSQKDRKKFDSHIGQGDYKAAADLFESRTKKLSKLEGILKDEPEAAATARGLIIETMQGTQSASLILAGQGYATSKTIESELAGHVKFTKQFAKTVNNRLNTLHERSATLGVDIAKVAVDLKDLREGQQATAFQLGIVQDILFEQQAPAMKLALLKGGAKPGLTVDQRNTVVRYLEVEVKKQEILAIASEVVSVASDVNTIMSNFGVKDKRIADAVRYGSVANAALSQAFSGNYIGAVATVSGLFGGAQQDPNQARFERVFAELEEIQKKLDAVLELQKKTLEAIGQLSQQLANTEQRLHERLDNIEFEIKTLNSATLANLWGAYQPCMKAWDQRSLAKYLFDDQTLQFRSAGGLVAFTNDWAADAAFPCASALRGMFSQLRSAGDFGNPLRLEFAVSQLPEAPPPGESRTFVKSEVQAYLDDVHRPAAGLVLSGWQARAIAKPVWGSVAGSFALLSVPAATASELLRRISVLDAAESKEDALLACGERSLLGLRAKTLLCADSAIFDPAKHGGREPEARERAARFLQDAIAREQVGYLVRWAGLVSGPSNLAPNGAATGMPLSLEELAANTSGSKVSYGRDILFSALTISDVAIAQQSMVYGDLTAYFIFEQLWDKKVGSFRSATTPEQLAAQKLLANPNNPWLQHNVMLLVLMNSERKCDGKTCKNTELGYQTALSPLFEVLAAPVQPVGQPLAAPTLVPINTESVDRARELFLAQFQLTDATLLEAKDASPKGTSTKRQVRIKLGGFDLPLPTVGQWATKAMSYPSGMMARISEREILAQRWADYAVLDTLDVTTTVRMVRAMSGGIAE